MILKGRECFYCGGLIGLEYRICPFCNRVAYGRVDTVNELYKNRKFKYNDSKTLS